MSNKPIFGEWFRNTAASEDNPQRDGMFVKCFVRHSLMNPGTVYELTDGRGEFWCSDPKNLAAIGPRETSSFQPEFETAFVTAVSDGSEKRYEVVFKFRDIHAMQAAHTAWVLRKDGIPADALGGGLLALYREFYDTVSDHFGCTHGSEGAQDGDPWWHGTDAAYLTREVVAAIETQDRARLDAKVVADEAEYIAWKAKEKAGRAVAPEPSSTQHGVNCQKAPHYSGGGYLHAYEDDSPYYVDGSRYCGRCHCAIGGGS